MNETIPPLPTGATPRTVGLAIWSLVLGILSLACFSIFTGIPGVICGHKALTKIKSSNGALSGQGLAIGGLVTGYLGIAWAVFFIPLMMAIAIPNFVKARSTAQANGCINNLRQIDAAANQFALEHHLSAGDRINFPNDLTPYIKLNSEGKIPSCPAGGVYHISKVGETPTCSLGTTVTPAHVLP
jgi:competence protein ComGC